ncbi:hypothetical protein WJS89_02905 [Sphingomicrobium sp. XHP0235]|uniref:hypothetical protein n=1 Tax=Sphingomicrobium aquimarinum TaxID=3133971 RepID=UPI0031FEDDAF
MFLTATIAALMLGPDPSGKPSTDTTARTASKTASVATYQEYRLINEDLCRISTIVKESREAVSVVYIRSDDDRFDKCVEEPFVPVLTSKDVAIKGVAGGIGAGLGLAYILKDRKPDRPASR